MKSFLLLLDHFCVHFGKDAFGGCVFKFQVYSSVTSYNMQRPHISQSVKEQFKQWPIQFVFWVPLRKSSCQRARGRPLLLVLPSGCQSTRARVHHPSCVRAILLANVHFLRHASSTMSTTLVTPRSHSFVLCWSSVVPAILLSIFLWGKTIGIVKQFYLFIYDQRTSFLAKVR